MPDAKQNSLVESISTYANNWVAKKTPRTGGDVAVTDDSDVGGNGGDGGGGDVDGDGMRNASSVREYSEAASVHGLKYVWAGDRSKYSRLLWALFFASMLIALGLTLFVQLGALGRFPTLTKQTVVMEASVLFPAVTICNLNQFRKSKIQNKTWLLQALTQMSEFSDMFEPINFTDPMWTIYNIEASPESAAHLLNYTSHPLNETLIGCRWKHKVHRCSELFKTVVTDFGVCYSFNTHETETTQRKSDLFGNMYGLSIIMNTNQPEYVLSQWNMASGFRVLLHGFMETPQMIEKGFSLGPGSSYFGRISGHKMTFLPAPFKAFGDKECIECDEGQMNGYLRYFPIYDRGACLLECQMNFTSNACGCRGLYDQKSDATESQFQGNYTVDHLNLCSPQVYLECYLPRCGEFRRSTSLRNSCKCPVPCKYQAYDVSLSMASYPSEIFMENLNRIQGSANHVDPKFYRTNIMELHLYYDNSQTVNIEQFPQYTFESIMSSLGGQMGVFLGASLISLVEFVDFLIGAVRSRLRKTKKCRVEKLNTVPERH